MTEYFLNTHLTFGKYEDYTVRQIFQYDPGYIDWLIEFTSVFSISLESISNLPTPTPCYLPENVNQLNAFFKITVLNTILKDNHVQKGLQFTSNGNILKESPHTFSEKLISILQSKKEGTYKPPKWDKQVYNME